MHMLRLSWIALIGVLILAACAREREPSPPPVPAPRERPPVTSEARVPSAAEFMARAGSIDLFLIRSSQLALARSGNARIKDFARRAVAAHQGTSSQLSFAGRRLNLLPSGTLLPEHQRMMSQMAGHQQIDSLYLRNQVMMHEAAIDLHSTFATRGSSPTLRAVAKAAVPIYRQHLAQLRAIR